MSERTATHTQELTQSQSAQQLPLEAVDLVAVDGPGRGARFTLSAGTASVGSSSRCDLVLRDEAVSRQHCTIELLHGAVRVRDLGSRNGLHYLGAQVEAALIPLGASLTIGRTQVRLTPRAEERLSQATEAAGLVAQSAPMRALLWRVERVAATDATVAITGPTGSGKEAVARAIHALSARAQAPFEVVDCAAARGELLESELFGHVKGAFTGATVDRAGLVELANRGTLLLDNVDAMPVELQTRLLRFLEERAVRRVGAASGRKVDVRVVATAQRPLEEAVAAGRLRSDVFFRLAEVLLEVPPLSARREDIPALARRFAAELTRLPVTLSRPTVAALQAHPWPGNVRELKNAVSRTLVFGRADLPEPTTAAGPQPAVPELDLKHARTQVLESFEADFLRALLRKHRWNVAAAARDAKVARSHLYTLIAKHQLSREG